jgi:hypothetical protein
MEKPTELLDKQPFFIIASSYSVASRWAIVAGLGGDRQGNWRWLNSIHQLQGISSKIYYTCLGVRMPAELVGYLRCMDSEYVNYEDVLEMIEG